VLAFLLLERFLLAFFIGSGCAARCCWFGHFSSQFSVLSSQSNQFAFLSENGKLAPENWF
jgi:hypothetical protein